LAWSALALFGLASATDDLVALSCVPGVDPGCRSGPLPVGGPWVDQVHTLTSVLAVLGLLACMALLRSVAGRLSTVVAVWLVCELASTVAVGACYLWQGPMGLPQAGEMVTEASWLALVSRWVVVS
jgi:hypothetical protein